jgi:hypothetical protein
LKPADRRQRNAHHTTPDGVGLPRRARKEQMPNPQLLASPLALLRRRYNLTMEAAAIRLDVSALCVARMEKRTQRFPADYLRRMTAALTPPPDFPELTLFDLFSEIDKGKGC